MSKVLLCIGTNKGAFLVWSDGTRKTWSIDGPILKGWDIRDLSIDRRGEAPVMWAAVAHDVYGPSVQRSTDMGKTWEQIENGPKYADGAPGTMNAVWTVVPGRTEEPGVLYAGVADAGLFKSIDGGSNWSELKGVSEHPTREDWSPGAGGLCCHTILLHPTDPSRMWIGISAVGAFRSDDSGETWAVKNEGLDIIIDSKTHKTVGSCVHRLVLDPLNPDRLYQQNHRGVFRSDNAGDSWTRIENGLPAANQFGFPMVVHPRDSDTAYIIPQEADEYRYAPEGNLAVFKTTDSGNTWSARSAGLPNPAYVGVLRQAMGIDSLDPVGVYFGTTGGALYFSADEGESWEAMPFQVPRVSSINAYVLE